MRKIRLKSILHTFKIYLKVRHFLVQFPFNANVELLITTGVATTFYLI